MNLTKVDLVDLALRVNPAWNRNIRRDVWAADEWVSHALYEQERDREGRRDIERKLAEKPENYPL